MNGAPLTRAPPRQSWGRGPSPSWGWRRIQARRSTCLLLLAVQRRSGDQVINQGNPGKPTHFSFYYVTYLLTHLRPIAALVSGGQERPAVKPGHTEKNGQMSLSRRSLVLLCMECKRALDIAANARPKCAATTVQGQTARCRFATPRCQGGAKTDGPAQRGTSAAGGS